MSLSSSMNPRLRSRPSLFRRDFPPGVGVQQRHHPYSRNSPRNHYNHGWNTLENHINFHSQDSHPSVQEYVEEVMEEDPAEEDFEEELREYLQELVALEEFLANTEHFAELLALEEEFLVFQQQLEERLPYNNGLTERTVSIQHLRTKVLRKCENQEPEICVVCQSEFEEEEVLVHLDCGHEYHVECITKWLSLKNLCPLCKHPALPEASSL